MRDEYFEILVSDWLINLNGKYTHEEGQCRNHVMLQVIIILEPIREEHFEILVSHWLTYLILLSHWSGQLAGQDTDQHSAPPTIALVSHYDAGGAAPSLAQV